MTTKTPVAEANTHNTPNWYQRLFAWLMAHGNAKYEQDMAARKRALCADLH
jgi:hypothetical protein